MIKKLGLSDGPELMDAINTVIETYGRSERNKYRAVVYYMLTKHFGKEAVYSCSGVVSPSTQIICHCVCVTGCTDNREFLTSTMSANRSSDLI